MKVETYEVEELKGSEATTMAADSEALDLCRALQLEGQLKLADTKTDTRCPYREMSAEEHGVYSVVFPTKTLLAHYRDGIIPVRVLQVAAHATELGFFNKGLYVWHPPAHQKDPLLVGVRSEMRDGESWESDAHYILARWGESLATLEELKVKARALLVERWKNKLKRIKAEVDTALLTIESRIDERLNEGGSGDPYFNWHG